MNYIAIWMEFHDQRLGKPHIFERGASVTLDPILN